MMGTKKAMKVKDLLKDESKWTKGCHARDASGEAVSPRDGCSWCLLGAVDYCYYPNSEIVLKKIRREVGGFIGIWNDSHTFEEVRNLIEELDI